MERNRDEKLLRETHELAQENNKLLRKMRRASILGGILKIVWWAIILGVPVYIYFTFAQPYIDQVGNSIEDARTTIDEVRGATDEATSRFGDLQGILQQLGIPVQ